MILRRGFPPNWIGISTPCLLVTAPPRAARSDLLPPHTSNMASLRLGLRCSHQSELMFGLRIWADQCGQGHLLLGSGASGASSWERGVVSAPEGNVWSFWNSLILHILCTTFPISLCKSHVPDLIHLYCVCVS